MRIGIYLPNWVGDGVMALAFVEKISRDRPGAAIVLIGKEKSTDLYGSHPAASEIQPLSDQDLHGLGNLIRTGMRLKALDLDETYLLTDSLRSAFLIRLAGSKARIGYAGQGRSVLLTAAVRPLKVKWHRSRRYAYLLDRAANELSAGSIHLSKTESDWAAEEMQNLGMYRPVACFPVSVAPSRTAPPNLWLGIINRLDEAKPPVLVFGSPAERARCEELAENAKSSAVRSVAGRYTLRQNIALISQCRGAIATDSGLGHVAAALGLPTLSLFGAGDPDQTRPIGARTAVYTTSAACGPCLKNDCPNRAEPLVCWTSMSVDKIVDLYRNLSLQPDHEMGVK